MPEAIKIAIKGLVVSDYNYYKTTRRFFLPYFSSNIIDNVRQRMCGVQQLI